MKDTALNIRKLGVEHSATVSSALTEASTNYVKWFHPFSFTESSVREVMGRAVRDVFFGLFVNDTLAGFFMLRGLDDGYERPSFGVFVAEKYSNFRLSKLALEYSLAWCRLSGIRAIMLKAHPDNCYARRIYERAGFKLIGRCPKTGHEMFEIRWE